MSINAWQPKKVSDWELNSAMTGVVLESWGFELNPTKLQRGRGVKFIDNSQDFSQLCICNDVSSEIPGNPKSTGLGEFLKAKPI